MNQIILYSFLLAILNLGFPMPQLSAQTPKLLTFEDSVAYALGMEAAADLLTYNLKGQAYNFRRGYEDQAAYRTLLWDFERIEFVVQEEEARRYQMRQRIQDSLTNLDQAFLMTLTSNRDFQTFENREIYYQVIKEGKGTRPRTTDHVTLHYHATLINGEVVHSSVQEGKPITLLLSDAVDAWQRVLPLIAAGGKVRIISDPISTNTFQHDYNSILTLTNKDPQLQAIALAQRVIIFDIELLKVTPTP